MKKYQWTKEEIFKFIVMVYFIVSPIFEVNYLYNHVTTLFRIICLLVFVLVVLILYKESRKKFWWLIAYYISMIGYLILNYVHSKGFISLVPGDFDYSFIGEAMTLVKLCMPFTILFILKYVKFSKTEFFKILNCWILIIAGSIVLFNLCGFSLSSYTNELTRYSIFSWGNDLGVNDIATKGWFTYANQEVLILLMLLVFGVYESLFVGKKYTFLVILISLSLLMLGTRLGTYGGLLSLIFIIIVYVLYCLFFKKKIKWIIGYLGIVLLIWVIVLPYTPCKARVDDIREASENIVKNVQKNAKKVEEKEDLEATIVSDFDNFEQNINKNLVGEQFYLKFYPYEYDKEFWNDVLEKQKDITLNYRVLELMIIQRVVFLDGRFSDYMLGISNSRIQNIVNIEQDFILHFYAYGIVGMIISLAFYGYSLIILVKGLFQSKKFIDMMILMCFSLFVLGAFVSGNNVNFLAAVVPLAFIVSFCKKLEEE